MTAVFEVNRAGTAVQGGHLEEFAAARIAAVMTSSRPYKREAGAIRGRNVASASRLCGGQATSPAGMPQRQSKEKRSLSDGRPASGPVTTLRLAGGTTNSRSP